MKYRPDVDGLRALAVVPVILFHAGFTLFSGGYVGVDVFFVISGYLITTILISDLRKGQFSIVRFYERRARRILPALYAIVVTSFVAGWIILLPADFERFSMSVVAVTTFWSNIFFWMESGYFDTETELKPLLHTWSLAVEEQFYIFFPLLLAALWRFGQRIVSIVLVAVLALSLSLVIWDFGMLSEKEAAFYLLPSRAWELMAGALVAIYLAQQSPRLPRPAIAGGLSFLGMLLILYSIFAFDKYTPFPSLYTAVPILGTALIILFERPANWSFRLLANPVCIGIGLVSYSAYLWHQPLFAYARYLSLHEPSPWIMAALSVLTLVLAYLSYRFVETPFRKKSGPTRSQVFIAGGAVGAVLVALGLVFSWMGGVPGRYDPRHIAVFEQFEDPGIYVRTRFNNARKVEFDPQDPRRKLLIIGDSYAQDMANAVSESVLSDRFQMSGFHISKRCGNLFLKHDFTDLIAPTDRALCAKREGYEDEGLQARIRQVDEIWLVSSWLDWHVENLPESLKNLRAITDARILVMGRKNFGSGMSLKRYMAEYDSGNENITVALNSGHIRLNDRMQALLPEASFVNISEMMCGTEQTCRNTTEDGLVISYDGSHLTTLGACLMGERLAQNLD